MITEHHTLLRHHLSLFTDNDIIYELNRAACGVSDLAIGVLGCSHHVAEVEFREKISWPEDRLPRALVSVSQLPGVDETLILNTCNRTEIYVVSHFAQVDPNPLIDWLAYEHGVSHQDIRQRAYFYHDDEAVRHLFRVTSGIDSMVIGETQITNQVKQAYRVAHREGTLGKYLHTLFNMAFAQAKQIHTHTAISENAVSVSYAAVELAKKIFGRLQGKKALLIGAGEVAELVARHLSDSGVGKIYVANRSAEKAEKLAQVCSGQALPLDRMSELLSDVDIVISSTGSPEYVLRRGPIAESLRRRRGRPLFLVDIAVPRDIDPSAGKLEGVFLYDIDDLRAVVQANLEERVREAEKAERIIDRGVQEFMTKLLEMDAVPLIRSLREKAEKIRHSELEHALRQMPQLGEREKEIVAAMSRLIVNKLLNDPMIQVKQLATEPEADLYLHAFARLFDLDAESGHEKQERKQAADMLPAVSANPGE